MSNKIRFLKGYKVKADDGPEYKEGEVVDVGTPESVEHFVRRGLAEEVTGTTGKVAAAAGSSNGKAG